jgi:hypothetical protein
MKNLKRKFENETKTRINIIRFANLKKPRLQELLIKKGIFEKTAFMNGDSNIAFPTEILCSSTKSNTINVFLSIKKVENLLQEIKESILNSIYEACFTFRNQNIVKSINNDEDELKKTFYNILIQFNKLPLNKFYEVDSIDKVFKSVNLNAVFNEVKKINCKNDGEAVDDKRDNFIWKNYFNNFETDIKKRYCNWMKRISERYLDNEEGHKYLNEDKNPTDNYYNKSFHELCKILYGSSNSCEIMIERAYIEAPSSKEEYKGNVYIDFIKDSTLESIAKAIESRISEDYKELFLIVAKLNEDIKYFLKFRESINKVTLNKRIFCILDEFESYKDEVLKNKNSAGLFDNRGNLINELKGNISKKIGIFQDRIIITERFKDINKYTLKTFNTNSDFMQLLSFIKRESERIGKTIKIKSSNKEEIISISLNQERMSVQALVSMLYERYNGYLVELWNKIIENEENSAKDKKYYFSKIHSIIQNRKNDYKEYKIVDFLNGNRNHKRIIDFSLRNGDNNDSKKILKMLVNYGYHTVGFNPNENKILINVNGEISQEDKEKLIKSIKGRLEESAINCFESAFLMDISNKKFNTNSLYKALEIEKNITIDDFYSAFKEIFKKMSDNIIRYEVCLQ